VPEPFLNCHFDMETFCRLAVSVICVGDGEPPLIAYLKTCSPAIQALLAFSPVSIFAKVMSAVALMGKPVSGSVYVT